MAGSASRRAAAQALEEDQIVLAMDGDESAGRARQPRARRDAGGGHCGQRIARLATERGVAFLEREREFVHRISAFQDGQVGLKGHAQFCAGIQDLVLRQDRLRGPVKGDHLRPLEARHLMDQRVARRGECRLVRYELREPAAEIAQREGFRRILRQESRGELHEAPVAEDRAHAGVIFIEAIQHTEPIGARVNLQALHGRHPARWLHKIRRDACGRAAIGPCGLEAVARRERTEERLGHHALELAQIAEGADPRRQQARLLRPGCVRQGTAWL